MKNGISLKSMDLILAELKKHPQVDRAAVFGSRAIGNYKPGSDIDIVLYGDLTDRVLNTIRVKLNEELPIPYYVDVVHYDALPDDGLKKHIDQYARTLYYRKNT